MQKETGLFTDEMIARVKKLGKRDKLPHAILVTGEDAYNYAKTLAGYLLCENDDIAPCSKCLACRKIIKDNHPDVIIVSSGDAHKSFHIDKIREIKADAYILPNEAEHKVYILNNAQNLTEQAENALLKILEEPPSFVTFILVADNPSTLLQTIISRVVQVKLPACKKDKAEQAKPTKAMDRSKEIAEAIIKPNHYDTLIATAGLIKSKDRVLLRDTFSKLREIFFEAIIIKSKGTNYEQDDISSSVACAFTLRQINDIISLIDEIRGYTLSNANKNIMVTYFCKAINDIKE